jgi:hypothetical protein
MDEMASSNLSLKELIPALSCPAENPIIFRAIAEFDRNPIREKEQSRTQAAARARGAFGWATKKVDAKKNRIS